MPVTVRARQSIPLAALPTAPGLAQELTRHLVSSWAATEYAEGSGRAARHLTLASVKATGRAEGSPTPQPSEKVATLSIQLAVATDRVRVEVLDQASELPTMLPEGTPGHFWGTCYVARGQRCTWIELHFGLRVPPALPDLPRRTRTTMDEPTPDTAALPAGPKPAAAEEPAPKPAAALVDFGMLSRALTGLRTIPPGPRSEPGPPLPADYAAVRGLLGAGR